MAIGDTVVVLEAPCAAIESPGLGLESKVVALRSPASVALAPDPTVRISSYFLYTNLTDLLLFCYRVYSWITLFAEEVLYLFVTLEF